jgi:hypothetical protein
LKVEEEAMPWKDLGALSRWLGGVVLAVALAGPSLAAEDEGIFNPGTVLQLRIDIPQEAVDQLRSNPRGYVRGTVTEGDQTYPDVGVRLKGSIGSFRQVDARPGITLKFNQFQKKQRFHGLRKLVLNNSVQDGTYLNQFLGNELFRAAGVPAVRTGHARIELSGRKLGLYVMTEGVTQDFLARWFKDPTGNLYEGPGDITSENLDVDTHGGRADRSDLRELAEACREADSTQRMTRLEKILDVDRFLSFLAMEAITCHWDGYMTGRNNYHLYHDPGTGKMVFFPHGTDQLFQNTNASIQPQANGTVAKAVLKTAAGRRRYRQRMAELVEKVFDVEAIQKRLAEIETAALGSSATRHSAARTLTARIAQRAQSLRDQLEGTLTISSGPPLPLDAEGKARLQGWQPRVMGGRPSFEKVEGEGEQGGPALKMSIGDGGECRASWRRKVLLLPGRYQLRARIRTEEVEPMTGNPKDGGRSGADIRLSGDQPKKKLLGTQDWTTYEFVFEIEPEEGLKGEQPTSSVEIVCELQGSRGTAWFDEGSLEIRRVQAPAAAGLEAENP